MAEQQVEVDEDDNILIFFKKFDDVHRRLQLKGYLIVKKNTLIENLVPEIAKQCEVEMHEQHCLYIEIPCFFNKEGPLNDIDAYGAY